MSIKELISREITPLKPQCLVKEALEMMDEWKVNTLPVVDNDIFVYLLTEKNLSDEINPSLPVSNIQGKHFCIHEQSHLFDLLHIMSQNELDLLPVVNDSNHYLGFITAKALLKQLAVICDAETPGAIIQMEMHHRDFMLSDLAHIAEQNNAHIMNLFTYPDKKTGKLQILVKVDQEDATYFLRSLERFNYRVIAHYHHDSMTDELIQQRMEELLYYIEM